MSVENLISHFEKVFGQSPEFISRAPGRVNLIGEHIDYCGGPVLPMAIAPEVRIAIRRRDDRRIRLSSLQFGSLYEGPVPVEHSEDEEWANYCLGVVDELLKMDVDVPGFDAAIDGAVPLGSGLSSSAALEVATGCAVTALTCKEIDPLSMAQLCQRAENKFVGVNCGLMDQAASACCRKGQALLLDCGTPKCEWVDFPDAEAAVVIAHSGVRRGLSASAYNERRGQCEESLKKLNAMSGNDYPNLCAVPMEVFERYCDQLSEKLRQRSRHVISETARVFDAVEDFRAAKLERLGKLLNESHYSLRDDYEVSCEELDELTEICRNFEGVYGSRLTGAGFGGCTVTLVRPKRAEALIEYLKENFYGPRGQKALAFVSTPSPGAEVKKV